jgi:hypothetical protein
MDGSSSLSYHNAALHCHTINLIMLTYRISESQPVIICTGMALSYRVPSQVMITDGLERGERPLADPINMPPLGFIRLKTTWPE